MGDSVQTIRTSNQRSEGRWETVYRHSGPLCKGQMGGGSQCRDTQDLYLNVRGELRDSVQTLRASIHTLEGRWEHPWYTLTGPLSEGQSGGGRQCTDSQDLYLKVTWEVEDSVQILRTSI